MFLSVRELFKIGIGPSSSHTMGPMIAAYQFIGVCETLEPVQDAHLRVHLHGSLAFTGKGHATDRAIFLGLLGQEPATVELDLIPKMISELHSCCSVQLSNGCTIHFNPEQDLHFEFGPSLPGHSNGMRFVLLDKRGRVLLEKVYYSIGGGFIQEHTEEQVSPHMASLPLPAFNHDVPYPFSTAGEMMRLGAESGLSIAGMKRANELVTMKEALLESELDNMWKVMNDSINRGLQKNGRLPGGLNVKRRAAEIYLRLKKSLGHNQRIGQHEALDWISVYAMAVNEENAAGGRIVTAPTNGAAGVVPAVMRYAIDHCNLNKKAHVHDYLLTAAAIGGLIKHNASISGAEVGCQGEVGSASAMAAAGFCAIMGGTNAQIENAAEIALEHHLGMTCDPIAGLVQVPCIERNAFGAFKAVGAASLALHGDGDHHVSLDACIRTMRETGQDMNAKYKETSLGGLAINIANC